MGRVGEPPSSSLVAGPVDRLHHRVPHALNRGWNDAAAWRLLREELARSWCDLPGVFGAAVIVRGTAALPTGTSPSPTDSTMCAVVDGVVEWHGEPPRLAILWNRLNDAPERVLCGAAKDLYLWGMPASVATRAPGWLATALPARGESELMVLLALTEPLGGEPDPVLVAKLSEQAEFLTPILGDRRRIAALASQLAGAQTEAEALARLDRLRRRLAAVTAHELRTPLTSIVAYADVLTDNADKPDFPHRREFLGVIRGETDRLVRMVDRLLDFSRRDQTRPLLVRDACEVAPLIGDTLTTLKPQAAAHDLRVRVNTAAGLPPVTGDADLIRQVLVNLVGNAIKYTVDGGCITVSAREDAAMIRVSVRDSGPGIAPDELRTIFQSFYRGRATIDTAGTGLGLSIVKDIVDLHDGHVDVRSRPGRGSTFSVLLPKAQGLTPWTKLLSIEGLDHGPVLRVLGHGLRLLAELTGARGTAVALRDASTGCLWPAACQGLPVPDPDRPLAWEGTPLARALNGEEVTPDRDSEPVLPWSSAEGGPVTGGWTAAALPLRGRVLGVVVAARRRRRGRFGGDAAAMVRVVGELLGAALAVVTRPGVTPAEIAAVDEALRTLGSLRQSGVPTAAPLALRLLARTARSLGLSTGAIKRLQYAGAMHDAGMVPLAPEIKEKPERLSPDERDEIDRHPARGVDLLGPLIAVPELRDVIMYHHEHMDGTGYPDGRRGGEIPLGSRILAVVDAFFAMIRNRPWRAGRPLAEVVGEIRAHAGSQFDPQVVTCFEAALREEGLLAAAPEATTSTETGVRHA